MQLGCLNDSMCKYAALMTINVKIALITRGVVLNGVCGLGVVKFCNPLLKSLATPMPRYRFCYPDHPLTLSLS